MYESLRTYVVTGYGLSEWYSQLDGVLQGGGLGPVLYIMAMHPMHLAVGEMQQGVPATIEGGSEVEARWDVWMTLLQLQQLTERGGKRNASSGKHPRRASSYVGAEESPCEDEDAGVQSTGW